MNRAPRRERLSAALAERDLAGFLVTTPTNVRYLTGYTGSNGVVCLGNEARFLTDFRYATSVAPLTLEWQVEIVEQNLLSDVAGRIGEVFGSQRVGFEASGLTYAAWHALDEAARAAGAELVPCEHLIEDLRAVKDAEEAALIRAGGEICDALYAWLAEEGLAGRSEREVAWAIEQRARELGAGGTSFPPVVASGANGAQPHAVPGELEIERSDLVVLDLGALVGGYCSDCTRTFATGPSDAQMMDVYETVLAAQEAALALVRPGQDCREVHETARKVIADAGYGEYFNHGTGHGVGLDIHEEPRFRNGFGGELAAGNVVTVEPGVYLPGRFGVRIEDLVLVTEDGYELLTHFPKSLLSV
ncbi:MAG TPA: Xaa-Pro peptidase family protein [Gaiellales bacterium]|jgi:Xaa-Pro aminopeptidase|nr:Xaa-Pro peptidase family protein [Gaiellales bacterium]